MLKFLVVVPTCNRNDLLSKCLDKLNPAFQTIGSSEYRVIISDDSKTNIAKELIEKEYPWATWVEGPKNGPARNRNFGASHSNDEWLVFIDDDCLPQNDILYQYKTAITDHPSSMAFEGCIIPDDWKKLKEDMSECPVNTTGGYFWSANICINQPLFKNINGFNESFLIAAQEDQDIYKRLLEHTEVTFIKQAIVIHPVRIVALSKKIQQIPTATKNWFIFEKTYNAQSVSRIFLTSLRFCYEFSRDILKNLLRGKPKTAIYHFCSLVIGVPVYLKLSIQNLKNG